MLGSSAACGVETPTTTPSSMAATNPLTGRQIGPNGQSETSWKPDGSGKFAVILAAN